MSNRPIRAILRQLVCAALIAMSAAVSTPSAWAASELAITVNNRAITTGDIQRRVAFLRLQRSSGDLNAKAREQLVNEALQMQEAARLNAIVGDDQVDQSVQRFAESNNLSPEQLRQILSRAGIGIEHFRSYVRAQMTWPRVVNARFGQQSGGMSNAELVSRMLERGEKPSTTEYILQQFIFVVPQDQRSALLGQRQREAEQMRSRFTSCEDSIQLAASLRDVTVRELGRVMQPELPPEWKEQIEGTSAGGTTGARTTDRGVEFIAVCSARQVSDDRAAEMVFRAEDQGGEEMQANAERYLEELKSRAAITNR